MCENCGYNNKLFWPLTLIFLGTLIMMVNVGILPRGLVAFWPVVLVVIGLVGLSGSCDNCRVKTPAVKRNGKKRR